VVVGSEVVDSEEEEEVSFVDDVVVVLLIQDGRCGIRWYADAWVSGRDGEEATRISSEIGRPRREFPLFSLDVL
jgi:hypothetical protein